MEFRFRRPAEVGGIRKTSSAAAILLLLAGLAVRVAVADVVTFQSGATIEGRALPVHGLDQRTARHAARPGATGTLPEPWWVVDDGVRVYFTPARITQVEQRQELSRVPEFTLPRTVRTRDKQPDVIGTSTSTPFDSFGRRTTTLKTSRGPIPIQQEITRIRPDYVEVTGISHEWTTGLDTRLLPDDVLGAILRRASDPTKIDDRKALISFYLDARRYDEASRELTALLKAQPELNEWGAPQLPLITEQKFRAAINKVQGRRKAGQHRLAYALATEALTEQVPADSLLQCQEILAEYETARQNAGEIQMLLEQYEAQLPLDEADRVRPLRPQLLGELHFESLARLEPFLRSKNDPGLTPSQKLALAYSGWVVGASFADVDLNVAVNLWNARFLVLEYIRENGNPLRRDEFIAELKKLEGVTMERLAEMIPLLPYVMEPMPPAPGEPLSYSLKLGDGLEVQYAVTLPSEYNPSHRYPVLVALRRSGMSLEETLRWWAGTAESPGMAMSRGYIVIAPEFATPEQADYDYDLAAHRRVMSALTDARKKFAIDSDRIFVAGHELGGDATFDIALSYPDVFAGAAPFVAQMKRYPRYLLQNGSHFPWYIVTGARHLPSGPNDPKAYADHLGSINAMAIKHRADVTYCEYKARGFESYHEELQRLFDWMDTHRRKSLRENRDEWEVDVLRPTSTRFFWVDAHEIPAKPPINWANPQGAGIKPMTFSGKIGLENKMYVSVPVSSGKAHATIWLNPSFFDFEKRLRVVLNSQDLSRVNSLIEPDPAALLEDFRIRGDRQQLFWAKVDL
jgi:predicted esterase